MPAKRNLRLVSVWGDGSVRFSITRSLASLGFRLACPPSRVTACLDRFCLHLRVFAILFRPNAMAVGIQCLRDGRWCGCRRRKSAMLLAPTKKGSRSDSPVTANCYLTQPVRRSHQLLIFLDETVRHEETDGFNDNQNNQRHGVECEDEILHSDTEELLEDDVRTNP